jgi:SAM-dependent methyltransferase
VTTHQGRNAELYDLFYADKPYEQEARFVHECLQRYAARPPRRVLELACGTGRHARALAALGYEVVATDRSEPMLACARRAPAAPGAPPVSFLRQDMRTLELPAPPFDAAVCLFDSIGFVQTNEAVRQVLAGVRRHLHPGGLFVFEFWHAPAMLRRYDPVRVRRWPVPQGEIVRITETRLDVANDLAEVRYTIFEPAPDGRFERSEETQMNRYFLVQEMAGRLSAAGFGALAWFGGFDFAAAVTEDAFHVVAVARADERPSA